MWNPPELSTPRILCVHSFDSAYLLPLFFLCSATPYVTFHYIYGVYAYACFLDPSRGLAQNPSSLRNILHSHGVFSSPLLRVRLVYAGVCLHHAIFLSSQISPLCPRELSSISSVGFVDLCVAITVDFASFSSFARAFFFRAQAFTRMYVNHVKFLSLPVLMHASTCVVLFSFFLLSP